MKANSSGSVTPVRNEANAAEIMMPAVALRRLVFAVTYIASAAPGRPNIMIGKNPAMYWPVTPNVPVPARKLLRSLMPATSNQNTELSAWCRPSGISRRFRNP